MAASTVAGETASRGQQLAAARLVRRAHGSHRPRGGQRDDPADEVPEPVRELGGGTGQRALPEVEVADARHAPHEPPAQRVGRVRVGQRGRVGAVAARLADLPAVDRQVVVDDDPRRQRLARAEQHPGPVHGVEPRDPLADHVDPLVRAAPPLLELAVVAAVPEVGDVVRERVEPDVDGLRRVVGHRDAPAAGAVDAARGAEVVEAVADEREHLVASHRRLDLEPARHDRLLDRVPVPRQPEEPVALHDPLGRSIVLRAAAVLEVAGDDERLAAGAVEALVVALVQVAARHARPPQRLDPDAVPPVDAGADERVVREVERAARAPRSGRFARRRTRPPARPPPRPRRRSWPRGRRCR